MSVKAKHRRWLDFPGLYSYPRQPIRGVLRPDGILLHLAWERTGRVLGWRSWV